MAKQGYDDGVFYLPDNWTYPPGIGNGAIWTNIRNEELHLYMRSEHFTIPHSGYDKCYLTKSLDQSFVKNRWANVSFNTETFDLGGMHDSTTNPERITIKKDGFYLITYQLALQSMSDQAYKTRIYKNNTSSLLGAIFNASPRVKPSTIYINNAMFVKLLKDDCLVLQVYHDHYESKCVYKDDTYFAIARIF